MYGEDQEQYERQIKAINVWAGAATLLFVAAALGTGLGWIKFPNSQAQAACRDGVSRAVLHLVETNQLNDAPNIDAILKESCK